MVIITHNLIHFLQQNRYWRSTVSWWRIESESSEILTSNGNYAAYLIDTHRHWLHWIFRIIGSMMREQEVWGKRWKWTMWGTVRCRPHFHYSRCSKTLTTLLLGNNGVSDDGAQHLGEGLVVNHVRHWQKFGLDLHINRCTQTLTTLDLIGNSIGTAGVRYLGEALMINHVRYWQWCGLHCHGYLQTLTKLDLSNNGVDAEGLRQLGEALKANHVRYCQTSTAFSLFLILTDTHKTRTSR